MRSNRRLYRVIALGTALGVGVCATAVGCASQDGGSTPEEAFGHASADLDAKCSLIKLAEGLFGALLSLVPGAQWMSAALRIAGFEVVSQASLVDGCANSAVSTPPVTFAQMVAFKNEIINSTAVTTSNAALDNLNGKLGSAWLERSQGKSAPYHSEFANTNFMQARKDASDAMEGYMNIGTNKGAIKVAAEYVDAARISSSGMTVVAHNLWAEMLSLEEEMALSKPQVDAGAGAPSTVQGAGGVDCGGAGATTLDQYQKCVIQPKALQVYNYIQQNQSDWMDNYSKVGWKTGDGDHDLVMISPDGLYWDMRGNQIEDKNAPYNVKANNIDLAGLANGMHSWAEAHSGCAYNKDTTMHGASGDFLDNTSAVTASLPSKFGYNSPIDFKVANCEFLNKAQQFWAKVMWYHFFNSSPQPVPNSPNPRPGFIGDIPPKEGIDEYVLVMNQLKKLAGPSAPAFVPL